MPQPRITFYEENLPRITGTSTEIWKKGMQITFSNGYTISAVYGTVIYCSCQKGIKHTKQEGCPDVEVAILDPNGEFVPFADGQSVRGYTTPEKLAEIFHWVSKIDNTENKD